ncbi:hypothetical protein OG331_21230 [Streptomyces sp. NBC_01017]|uniref:hypothetical protein n=1 Tax=Streptomyces sp. NBC_01017 TaxID=2903721 RepID=UPI0038657AB9|nr:hypothetical protein OG331_21230 [Streptomyces sp. NBC_01017]
MGRLPHTYGYGRGVLRRRGSAGIWWTDGPVEWLDRWNGATAGAHSERAEQAVFTKRTDVVAEWTKDCSHHHLAAGHGH